LTSQTIISTIKALRVAQKEAIITTGAYAIGLTGIGSI
jgi:hypothetical protein